MTINRGFNTDLYFALLFYYLVSVVSQHDQETYLKLYRTAAYERMYDLARNPITITNPTVTAPCFRFSRRGNIPVFWINLRDEYARAYNMETQFRLLGMKNQRIEAVNLSLTAIAAKYEEGLVFDEDEPESGELGCLYSHLIAIHTAVNHPTLGRGNNYAIIMEDDVQLELDVNFMALAKSAPRGFGILQLMNSNFNEVIKKYIDYQRYVLNQEIEHKGVDYGNIWSERSLNDSAWSTQAYLINKVVLKPIINRFVRRDQHGNYRFQFSRKSFGRYCQNLLEVSAIKSIECRIPFRLVADVLLYELSKSFSRDSFRQNSTYVTRIPMFNGISKSQWSMSNGASYTSESRIHSKHNVLHANNFQLLGHLIRNIRGNSDVLPPFMRIPDC